MPVSCNLGDGLFQADADGPLRIMSPHLAQIADVAAMVANAIFIHMRILLRFAGMLFSDLEGFLDGTGVLSAAT